MDCKDCKTRHRADKLIEDFTGESADGWSNEKMMDFIKEHHIQCPQLRQRELHRNPPV